ncbi:hypothetical protein [Sphingomonas turrisvirgatae]|uniref:Uncharacterized protein n=1 Tax=Sphingomonas turrisvirgatae TaxID=1888892 RepID=A0A1E3LZW4_9SPHN|nr:hypothetical protein [Sphingomonas turrisvirgatae]ODP39263.1 hypothetical protein BFL28_10645 [Sphingomonas turrisvirgatae]
MSDKQRRQDMEFLVKRPEFLRFLFRSIQMAGVLDQTTRATNGSDGRDLAFVEGRRSLGFDILREADAGQPAPMQHPYSLITLIAALREEAQSQPEEKKRGGRDDRYSDGDDGSGDAG